MRRKPYVVCSLSQFIVYRRLPLYARAHTQTETQTHTHTHTRYTGFIILNIFEYTGFVVCRQDAVYVDSVCVVIVVLSVSVDVYYANKSITFYEEYACIIYLYYKLMVHLYLNLC